MLDTIGFPRDGRATIIYGFPTLGKSFAGGRMKTWDGARVDYATKRPIRVFVSDTDSWFAHAKATNQPDRAEFFEIARLMLDYTATAIIPRDSVSVLFTSFNHVEYSDPVRVFGFVPASSSAIEKHLRMREDNWSELLPRFVAWYDKAMSSATVQQLIKIDHLIALKPGDYIANHLSLAREINPANLKEVNHG